MSGTFKCARTATGLATVRAQLRANFDFSVKSCVMFYRLFRGGGLADGSETFTVSRPRAGLSRVRARLLCSHVRAQLRAHFDFSDKNDPKIHFIDTKPRALVHIDEEFPTSF